MKRRAMKRREKSRAGLLQRFFGDEDGATAIEYSLIVALIFLAIVGAVRNFTNENNRIYGEITSAMASTSTP